MADHFDNQGGPGSSSMGTTNEVWDKNPKWKWWEIMVAVIASGFFLTGIVFLILMLFNR